MSFFSSFSSWGKIAVLDPFTRLLAALLNMSSDSWLTHLKIVFESKLYFFLVGIGLQSGRIEPLAIWILASSSVSVPFCV